MAPHTPRRLVIVGIAMFGLGAFSVGVWTRDAEPVDAFHIVVGPGERPGLVPIDITDAPVVEIDAAGSLVVRRGETVRRFSRPQAYQHIVGVRRDVAVRFEITPAGDVRFALGAYDHGHPLYINAVGFKGQDHDQN
jgi:hypothetical protein